MTEILNIELYNFLFIFLRVGGALMFMPGFSTSYVTPRMRLSVAVALAFILIPFLADELKPVPENFLNFIEICVIEITYGVFLGLTMQILFSALALVGNFAGQSIGFANAQIFDPTTQHQSVIIEAFLSILAIAIIFATNIHHLMISAVIDSYKLFPFGQALQIGDMADFLATTLNKSFVMGFKIASPFIAFMIVFYSGMGLVSRLMPQLNIFFLSLPLQIYLGLGLLLIIIPIMMLWFLKYFEEGLVSFV